MFRGNCCLNQSSLLAHWLGNFSEYKGIELIAFRYSCAHLDWFKVSICNWQEGSGSHLVELWAIFKVYTLYNLWYGYWETLRREVEWWAYKKLTVSNVILLNCASKIGKYFDFGVAGICKSTHNEITHNSTEYYLTEDHHKFGFPVKKNGLGEIFAYLLWLMKTLFTMSEQYEKRQVKCD